MQKEFFYEHFLNTKRHSKVVLQFIGLRGLNYHVLREQRALCRCSLSFRGIADCGSSRIFILNLVPLLSLGSETTHSIPVVSGLACLTASYVKLEFMVRDKKKMGKIFGIKKGLGYKMWN